MQKVHNFSKECFLLHSHVLFEAVPKFIEGFHQRETYVVLSDSSFAWYLLDACFQSIECLESVLYTAVKH